MGFEYEFRAMTMRCALCGRYGFTYYIDSDRFVRQGCDACGYFRWTPCSR